MVSRETPTVLSASPVAGTLTPASWPVRPRGDVRTVDAERGTVNDQEVFEAVRGAVIWAKAEVVAVAPGQVVMTSLLAEPPICLDSLESITMVTHLEETLGLVAEDEHFFAGSVRTVGDVVAAVKGWIAGAESARR